MNKSVSKVIAVLILSILISNKNFAQTDTSSVKPHIIACADSMVKAFSKGDYNTMARFTNDALVKMLGGKEKYAATLKKTMTEGDMAKVKIEQAKTGKIIKVVKTSTGFQCLVEQKTMMVFGGKRIKNISALHGYSDNNGKLWKFADIGDKDAATIKMFIPDFDKRLIIPKNEETIEDL